MQITPELGVMLVRAVIKLSARCKVAPRRMPQVVGPFLPGYGRVLAILS
jgi:hypothetical protein